ncbi:hypothetical protein UPYG_G00138900 [Umbra pygmaea]|uniref:SKICH domain-containing protein n=1 Tax=Umbra pygmaea TaxID=75934 RepID=A0ABD0WVE3_UMBPY
MKKYTLSHIILPINCSELSWRRGNPKILMERAESAAGMDLSTTFSQVVFQDIPHSYPPNVPVICCYTLTSAIQPNSRDWVGIFKVGWSNKKDYHTFVWVEPSEDRKGEEPIKKQVVFTAYYLPKDDADFFQFCYVDCNGQVRGASTPFCFKSPVELSTDYSLENDIMVITTQENVDQRERENEELVRELRQQKELNETLSKTLKEQQQEIDHLKLSNEESHQAYRQLEMQQQTSRELVQPTQSAKPMDDSYKTMEDQLEKNKRVLAELNMEMQQLKEQNEFLTSSQEQQKEVDHFTSLTTVSEKYEKALTQIKQLKSERAELKENVEGLRLEITQLSTRLKQLDQESNKLKDTIQLLQLDLQSSEKEKDKLSTELSSMGCLTYHLEGLKTENKALRRSLSEQEKQPLQKLDSDLTVKCEALNSQLKEAETQLHKEQQASENSRRRAEHLERDLKEARERIESVVLTSEHLKLKSSKEEMFLIELREKIQEKDNIADIIKKESEELSEENQGLKRDIERLREELAELRAAPVSVHYSNPYGSEPEPTHNTEQNQETLTESLQFGNPYELPGTAANPEQEELYLECRHCHEYFPGITTEELEQHELSHRVCPFCTLICDDMEQASYEDHVYSHEV